MFEVDSHVVKNYEILILLLKQLGNSDVEVKKTNKGMEIDCNFELNQYLLKQQQK